MGFETDLRQILVLDEYATVRLTTHTDPWLWYVQATIEISDGRMLYGLGGHAETPDEAVANYLHRLRRCRLGGDDYVIVHRHASSGDRERLAYQWDPAAGAFASVVQRVLGRL